MSDRVTLAALLADAQQEGDFAHCVVSTQQGLPVTSVGRRPELVDVVSALTALFDDVVTRAERDAGLSGIDEVTLRDGDRGRLVVRPLGELDGTRLFLVVDVPPDRTWRRVTNKLCRAIADTFVSRHSA
ncbi:MAG: roadblock/LC7 domain-containing protein [Alphaproteobacteria bacterium]|nr:roadblock/LC7 domain-containing protein [Alphaproteobacteria bacterium]